MMVHSRCWKEYADLKCCFLLFSKAMAELAYDLHNKQSKLKNPLEIIQKKLSALNGTTYQSDDTGSEVDGSSSAPSESETSSVAETSEEEEEFVTMPKKKTVSILKSPTSTSPELNERLSTLSLNGPVQPVSGTLGIPYLSGRWECFDHTPGVKAMKAYILMRMVINSGTQAEDIKLAWENERAISIKMAWPTWLQDSTMMSGVDIATDATGVSTENYPSDHKVYDSMGLTSKRLEEDDGKIYSTAVFKFKNRMDITDYKPEFFDIVVDNENQTATILQIKFSELIEDKPFASPITKKQGGTLKFSKSPSRKRPVETSRQSNLDQEENTTGKRQKY